MTYTRNSNIKALALFYAPELITGDTVVELGKEESFHCIKSLRHQAGDQIKLTNGKGLMATGIITDPDRSACKADVIETEIMPVAAQRLELAVAPTKNHDRYEWLAEKSTEIGVDVIIPLICARSERKKVQHERLQRILVSAMKQSFSCFLPEIRSATGFEEYVKEDFTGQKLIAWCDAERENHLQDALRAGVHCRIVIGPEGDFSPEEIQLATLSGYLPVSLGKKRLRTETAGLVSCHIFNLKNT